MINKIIVGVMILMTVVTGRAVAQNQDKEQAAVRAAESWLKLVDDGKYAQSWAEAADNLKIIVTQQQMDQSFKSVREPLGKIITRKVKNTQYTTSLPGMPDGEYVVIQFESSFENKQEALEAVIPMIQKDSIWRVIGYSIK